MQTSNQCPGCQHRSTQPFDTCPKCGIIIEKYLAKQAEREHREVKKQEDELRRTEANRLAAERKVAEEQARQSKATATVRCKYCSMEIPKAAKICPYCRKKLKLSALNVLVLLVVGLFLFPAFIGVFGLGSKSQRPSEPQSTTTATASPQTATLPPKEETWGYGETKDEMTGEIRRYATKTSVNTVDFGFPYQGSQHGTIMLTRDSVLFYIKKGQIICQDGNEYGTCSTQVKFDENEPQYMQARKVGDDSTTIRIEDSTVFESIKRSRKIMIKVKVYQEGFPVFTFDLGGLKPF